MREKVDIGLVTKEDYAAWRKDRLMTGEQFNRIKSGIAKELSKTNETALAYVNGELPEVFAANYNDMGTAVVGASKNPGIRFDLVDGDTVRLLASKDSDLLPYKKLDIPADERWNKKKMQSELLQGILLGEPVPDIASRLEKVTGMNRNSAVRNARTMITGAENSGRLESVRRLTESGVILKRVWMAAHDNVVRDLHRELDGQERGVEEPFEVGGYKIMYPGDPAGAPEMVYNCRCTTGVIYKGYKKTSSDSGLTNQETSGIIQKETAPKKYLSFNTGQEVNDFFYYDDEKRGLLAKKKSAHSLWEKNLTKDETEAISDYTGGGYYDLNSYLRKTGDWESINAEKEEFLAQNLDSAIAGYDLKDNIRVQRGVLNDVIDMLAEQNNVQNSLDELIGTKFIDNGYLSTSVLQNNTVVTSKPTVIDIEIPAGKGRGAYVNQLAGQFQDTEYEFLIKRGASFTITEIREEEFMGEFRYYVKMVMDDE